MNTAQKIISADFDIDNLDALTRATHACGVRFDVDGNAISGFHIVGKNSDEYLAAQAEIRSANLQRSAKRKEQIDASTPEGATAVVNVMISNERTTAMAVVTGWFGFNKGGQPMEFDKAVVAQMFDKMPTWQSKVLDDLDKEANFTKV